MRSAILALLATALPGPALAGSPVAVADLSPGAHVIVSGTVARVTDEDEFVLSDGTDTVEVYVGPARHGLAPGTSVTVEGTVDDDGDDEIYAARITLPDGSVLLFAPD